MRLNIILIEYLILSSEKPLKRLLGKPRSYNQLCKDMLEKRT